MKYLTCSEIQNNDVLLKFFYVFYYLPANLEFSETTLISVATGHMQKITRSIIHQSSNAHIFYLRKKNFGWIFLFSRVFVVYSIELLGKLLFYTMFFQTLQICQLGSQIGQKQQNRKNFALTNKAF